jgi:hypothetical protein
MLEEQLEAGEVDEAEKVLDVVFPSGDEPAEVMHPGKESLYLPTSSIAPQLASILRLASAPPVGRDQLDAVCLRKLFVELV